MGRLCSFFMRPFLTFSSSLHVHLIVRMRTRRYKGRLPDIPNNNPATPMVIESYSHAGVWTQSNKTPASPKSRMYNKLHRSSQFQMLQFPLRLPSLHCGPRTRHLPIPSSFPRGIISLQDSCLTLIRLTESIAPLLPHSLYLSDLSNGLLELLHPRSIILNVVLLDFLDVMVGLWSVHTLGIFPRYVAHKAEERNDKSLEPENWGSEEAGDHAVVLGREVEQRSDSCVGRDERQPDDHAARDEKKGPFCPDIRDQSGFPKYSGKYCCVEACSPDPVPSYLSITLW